MQRRRRLSVATKRATQSCSRRNWQGFRRHFRTRALEMFRAELQHPRWVGRRVGYAGQYSSQLSLWKPSLLSHSGAAPPDPVANERFGSPSAGRFLKACPETRANRWYRAWLPSASRRGRSHPRLRRRGPRYLVTHAEASVRLRLWPTGRALVRPLPRRRVGGAPVREHLAFGGGAICLRRQRWPEEIF